MTTYADFVALAPILLVMASACPRVLRGGQALFQFKQNDMVQHAACQQHCTIAIPKCIAVVSYNNYLHLTHLPSTTMYALAKKCSIILAISGQKYAPFQSQSGAARTGNLGPWDQVQECQVFYAPGFIASLHGCGGHRCRRAQVCLHDELMLWRSSGDYQILSTTPLPRDVIHTARKLTTPSFPNVSRRSYSSFNGFRRQPRYCNALR